MPINELAFDSTFFRTAMGRFATGVTVITGEAGFPGQARRAVGLTVNSFNAVSLSPPLVLWSLSRSASTHDAFMACERYVIQVLSAEQRALALRFASGTQAERFTDAPLARAPGGGLMLDVPSVSWFECTPYDRHMAGDHTIMVSRVRHCGYAEGSPLIFHAGSFELTPMPALVDG